VNPITNQVKMLLQKLSDPSPMLVIDPMVNTEETKSD
jgi:hypothetical protein